DRGHAAPAITDLSRFQRLGSGRPQQIQGRTPGRRGRARTFPKTTKINSPTIRNQRPDIAFLRKSVDVSRRPPLPMGKEMGGSFAPAPDLIRSMAPDRPALPAGRGASPS